MNTQLNSQLEKARELARQGRYEQAAREFASWIETSDTPDPQVLLELGFALLLAGDKEGALIIYQSLETLIPSLSAIPENLDKLWRKFCHLVTGAQRKLVITGVTAALIAGGAAAPQKAFSAHRYSGGVNRPFHQLKPFRPGLEPGGHHFSGHKYSGGVLTQQQLIKITSQQPTASSTGTQASTPTVPLVGFPPLRPGSGDGDRPVFSGHKYSGGVRFNLRKILERKVRERKRKEELKKTGETKPGKSRKRRKRRATSPESRDGAKTRRSSPDRDKNR